jgi:hypothetical protein
MQSVSLFGMLSAENKEQRLWDMIITNGLSRDNYDAHRAIAVLSKKDNKFIEDRYRQDKKHIKQLLQDNCSIMVPEHISWNKNFSACAWRTVEHKPSRLGEKKLILTSVGWDKNREINIKIGTWKGYEYPAIDDQRYLFFDNEGTIFYYGYGRYDIGCHPTILEYSLNIDGEVKHKRCRLVCSMFSDDYNKVLNFPVLLKAILGSTQTREFVDYPTSEKIYEIKGITIPDDYKTFKPYIFRKNKNNCSSYDQLDNNLKKAIDGRYAEQQREKNSTVLSEKK